MQELVNGTRAYGCAVAKEGEQYKYYKNINISCNDVNSYLRKIDTSSSWWLRSPNYNNNGMYGKVDSYGKSSAEYANNTPPYAIPGFCI